MTTVPDRDNPVLPLLGLTAMLCLGAGLVLVAAAGSPDRARGPSALDPWTGPVLLVLALVLFVAITSYRRGRAWALPLAGVAALGGAVGLVAVGAHGLLVLVVTVAAVGTAVEVARSGVR